MISIATAHLDFLSIFVPQTNKRLEAEDHLSVTKPAGGPDLLDAGAVHEVLHQVPLLLRLKGDKVHAALPGEISSTIPLVLCPKNNQWNNFTCNSSLR